MTTKFVKTLHPLAKHRRLAVFQYRITEPVVDIVLLERIKNAWRKSKSVLGYCAYTDIYSLTRIPYAKIFGVLKWYHKSTYKVHFSVDRMGNNVYVKFT